MRGDLLGSVAGPWTVTKVDGSWVTVTHNDGSTRLLKHYAAEDLLAGAKRNGLVSVRAKRPEAPKPVEPIPVYALGSPADQI